MSERQESQESPSSSPLLVFEATKADREAVLAIDAGYDELDYLPYLYDEHVEGHGVKGFVLRKSLEDSTVIGFVSTLLVDGGNVAATKAGRVSQTSRGGGLYGKFTRECFRRLGVEKNVMVVNNHNMKTFSTKLENKYTVSHEHVITAYKLNFSQTDQQQTSTQVTSPEKRGLHRMTLPDLENFLDLHPKVVFPDGRMTIEFFPLRVMKENALALFERSKRRAFFVSGVEFAESGKIERVCEEREQLGFSCGSYFESPSGLPMYMVNMYGDEASAECLKNHLRCHIERLLQLCVSQGQRDKAQGHRGQGQEGQGEVPQGQGHRAYIFIFYKQELASLFESLKEEFRFEFERDKFTRDVSPFRVLDAKC